VTVPVKPQERQITSYMLHYELHGKKLCKIAKYSIITISNLAICFYKVIE
jgi:hypothetical protein